MRDPLIHGHLKHYDRGRRIVMAIPKKILVAFDGSLHSKAALGWAMLLSGPAQAELAVIKVFEPILLREKNSDYEIGTRMAQMVEESKQADWKMLANVKEACERQGVAKVHADLLEGHVASVLLDYARQSGADLIVAGTRGHGALDEMLVGSVTSTLVSLAEVPVLVVKDREVPPALHDILVAYDGSKYAKAALAMAVDLAKLTGAGIMAVKVVDPLTLSSIYSMAESGSATRMTAALEALNRSDLETLAEAKTSAAAAGVEIVTELLSGGGIADSINRAAVDQQAGLVIAGTLGHGLLGELLMGSVTRKLIALSTRPVLIVKK